MVRVDRPPAAPGHLAPVKIAFAHALRGRSSRVPVVPPSLDEMAGHPDEALPVIEQPSLRRADGPERRLEEERGPLGDPRAEGLRRTHLRLVPGIERRAQLDAG